ncbi:three-Cys-motif partner protein TcmP [Halorubrum sp. ASP121]|uniref:three-Cys-motif partner protein TcmP n=1 Tax=Halorubrum sp. ASP121 TaxID=1855858 RepID=UPI0010F55C33|nr:three-Cys-motif partner protein TcmP [Halorubrum sp. ASP121]TKX49983.1 three-Cys-motif partner protein TcmP [Halorubrum sp. ASP121]
MEDPVKPDDSDTKWKGYHGHTRAKHNLLDYYLNPWMKILGSNSSKLRVFDCFAGRGDYLGEQTADPVELEHIDTSSVVPGSPQIILNNACEFIHLTDKIECVFIEKEEKNARILSENLPDESKFPDGVSYDIVVGKFQDKTIPEIEQRGGWDIPTFLFIDPFGYSQLDYDVVTTISQSDGFEVLINLMASQVVRWQDVDKQQDALQRPFGTSAWREELETHQAGPLDDKEVSYYCRRLEENGPKHTIAYLVTREDSDAMVYYMIFGTNNPKGLEVMRDAMNEIGPGEFAYAPNRPGRHQDQAGLDSWSENEVRQKLKELFSGRELSFESIVSEYVQEATYSTHRRKDIRRELKDMEDEGIIGIERITSQTPAGLSGDDVVNFPQFE